MTKLTFLKNSSSTLALAFAVALAGAAPVQAISFGSKDDTAHPNVGALVFVNNDGTRGGSFAAAPSYRPPCS